MSNELIVAYWVKAFDVDYYAMDDLFKNSHYI